MRRTFFVLGLTVAFLAPGAWAQEGSASASAAPSTTHEEIYCSGMVTNRSIPTGTQLVSGEESNTKLTFSQGDYVYINKGSSQGVKAGDEFLVMRPYNDDTGIPWYGSQDRLLRAMGQPWADEGRLKVVVAQPNVSIAQITDSCSYMLRGDIVLPFAERPVPELKSEANFDRFAPFSGKAKGRVVMGRNFEIESGTGDIVYVNLGSSRGIKPGDYFRIYRYQGNDDNTVYQTPGMATEVDGMGAASKSISPQNLPREILGEGIVLRTSPKSSTVLITFSLREIYEGDLCELE